MIPGIAAGGLPISSEGSGDGISFVGGKTFTWEDSTPMNFNSLTGGSNSTPSPNDFYLVGLGIRTIVNQEYIVAYETGMSLESDLLGNDTVPIRLQTYKGFIPPSPVGFTLRATSVSVFGIVLVFRGVNLATPLDVPSQTMAGGNTILVNPPPITPVTPGAWPVVIGGGGHNNGISQYFLDPSDITNIFKLTGPNKLGNATGLAGLKKDWSSGEFDPEAWSFSASDNSANSRAAITLALRPN